MVATSFHAAGADPAVVITAARPPRSAGAGGGDAGAHEFGVVKLFPTQMRFVTGIARAYDDDFPPELRGMIKEQEFETAINQINNTMKDYWPCFFCICCGYTLCPCTAGISLLCPNLCIRDAEQYVRALIVRINKRYCFTRAGIQWRLMRSCGRSWIEIEYPMTQKPIMEISYQTPILDANGAALAPLSRIAYTNGNAPTIATSTTSATSTAARQTAASPLIIDV